MEIKKCKFRLRCEMGACGKRAEYTIQPARVGIRSSVHVCGDCLDAIVAEGGKLRRSAKTAKATAVKKPGKADGAEGRPAPVGPPGGGM